MDDFSVYGPRFDTFLEQLMQILGVNVKKLMQDAVVKTIVPDQWD